jgi:hypothetical protein
MSAKGNAMLSAALNSLEEIKRQLQGQLAERPEYRALLIIEDAALRLAEALTPSNPSPTMRVENVIEAGPAQAILAAAPMDAVANDERRDDRPENAPIEATAAVEQPAPASPIFAHSGNCVEDRQSQAEAGAQPEESVEPPSHVIDLFLSSTTQDAPLVGAPPRPRSYLPFVAAPRTAKNAG